MLITGRLQETHRGKVASAHRVEKVVDIVLMIGRVAIVARSLKSTWDGMLPIGSGGVILKRCMMRNVISLRDTGDLRRVRALASGGSVRVRDRQVETALEPAPANAGRIQQVANVLTAHLQHFASSCRTHIAEGIGITDYGETTVSVRMPPLPFMFCTTPSVWPATTLRALPSTAQTSFHRRCHSGVILRVVPQRGHRIAVEVPHDHSRRPNLWRSRVRWRSRGPHVKWKKVHQSAIKRHLLRTVIVVLVRVLIWVRSRRKGLAAPVPFNGFRFGLTVNSAGFRPLTVGVLGAD